MVALRHLRSRRKHAFVSLITVISILGIMVGVAALITVISVMTGFSSYMQDRILGTTSHILITGAGGVDDAQDVVTRVLDLDDVVAAAPYVMGQSLLKVEGDVTGVVVRGIDPVQEAGVTDLAGNMTRGSLEDLDDKGIVIGVELARQRGLRV